jgi:hypothetical protein
MDTKTYLGLIANHSVSPTAKSEGWAVRSWVGFIEEFKNRSYGDSTDLFRGYLQYVREVCGVKELKVVKFPPGSLRSLFSFNCMIERILKQAADDRFETAIQNNYVYNFGEGWSGYYFTLRRKGTESTIWSHFGIDYFSEHPYIYVYLDKENKDYWKIVQNLAQSNRYELCRGKVNGDCLWMKMPSGAFDRLNNGDSVENQLNILGSYFVDCCHALMDAWSTG